MNRSDKKNWVESMHDMMQNTDSIFVAHYQGLTVSAMENLRHQVRQVGGLIKVPKNRLMRLALENTNYAPLGDLFKEATVVLFNAEPVDLARILVNFSKENELLKVAGGAVGTDILSVEGVKYYATLPSMDELRGTLVGLLQAPASKLARVVQAPASQLARVFQAYADK
ncbi:MAG: 50S ribosomal protein L10 [Alphaproteobacteria bacterium]|nr:50S ribosomal protein L10 [Alphaproteobacteria bacterium]